MKKLLLAVGLAIVTSLVANAQDSRHYSFSFLPSGIDAITVTNTLNITNLLTEGSMGTNLAGTTFTNLGTRVVVAGTVGASVQLLGDVNLWIPKDGRMWNVYTNDLLGPLYTDNPMWISMTYDSGSGANSAMTLVFTPMADDNREVNGNPFTWSITAVASQTQLTVATNLQQAWQWPGAKKLRVRRVVNADADASSQVIITDLNLEGYK